MLRHEQVRGNRTDFRHQEAQPDSPRVTNQPMREDENEGGELVNLQLSPLKSLMELAKSV